MINSICLENEITLYWDLPVNFEKGDTFSVVFDGKEENIGEKTHVNIKNLESDSEYCFQVFYIKCEAKSEIGKIVCKTDIKRHRIDVTKAPYNAVGDGKTLNTAALQRAIDDCKAGECVYIPEGDFMTGSLFLHSDMDLYLEKGAILHGTVDVKDYSPKIKSRFEGHEMMCYSALLNCGELEKEAGITCKNVRIMGEGIICGGGRALALNVIEVEKVLLADYIKSLGDKVLECENSNTIPGRPRPRLINISCAENILIYGVGIQNGASWNVHMIYSKNICTYGCTFRSEEVWNGDGWDPDSSENCTIFGCEFFTGDDAVAIKSGKNPEGNIINKPSRNIRVFDCISHYGHGITIGSEMSGGVEGVYVWNCDMGTSTYGVEIKGTKKRGGFVRDIHVKNCRLCRVLMHSVGYNDDGEGAPHPPVFRDCSFEDLEITGIMYPKEGGAVSCEAIEIAGFDEDGYHVENVKFKNIVLDDNGGRQTFYVSKCRGISFENISCK